MTLKNLLLASVILGLLAAPGAFGSPGQAAAAADAPMLQANASGGKQKASSPFQRRGGKVSGKSRSDSRKTRRSGKSAAHMIDVERLGDKAFTASPEKKR